MEYEYNRRNKSIGRISRELEKRYKEIDEIFIKGIIGINRTEAVNKLGYNQMSSRRGDLGAYKTRQLRNEIENQVREVFRKDRELKGIDKKRNK